MINIDFLITCHQNCRILPHFNLQMCFYFYALVEVHRACKTTYGNWQAKMSWFCIQDPYTLNPILSQHCCFLPVAVINYNLRVSTVWFTFTKESNQSSHICGTLIKHLATTGWFCYFAFFCCKTAFLRFPWNTLILIKQLSSRLWSTTVREKEKIVVMTWRKWHPTAD